MGTARVDLYFEMGAVVVAVEPAAYKENMAVNLDLGTGMAAVVDKGDIAAQYLLLEVKVKMVAAAQIAAVGLVVELYSVM
jgi:hypothetical protein